VNRLDYYDVLGVPHEASAAEIRNAFRARMAQTHPDRNASATAQAEAALINEAWMILRDPERRRQHDDKLNARRKAATAVIAQGPSVQARVKNTVVAVGDGGMRVFTWLFAIALWLAVSAGLSVFFGPGSFAIVAILLALIFFRNPNESC
jgi:DnaJ-class molecular chaperone